MAIMSTVARSSKKPGAGGRGGQDGLIGGEVELHRFLQAVNDFAGVGFSIRT